MDTMLSRATLAQRACPVVLEFWAPWCAPCRAMAPHLERVSQAFAGQVDLVKVNAGEHPEIAAQWGVRSVPTIIALDQGQEVARLHGSQPGEALAVLFRALAAGQHPTPPSLPHSERLLRLATGGTLAVLALVTPVPWPVGLFGGLIVFSAVHDRCPLLRAVRSSWARRKRVNSALMS